MTLSGTCGVTIANAKVIKRDQLQSQKPLARGQGRLFIIDTQNPDQRKRWFCGLSYGQFSEALHYGRPIANQLWEKQRS
jgi:hypothetical protein